MLKWYKIIHVKMKKNIITFKKNPISINNQNLESEKSTLKISTQK